jgi:flagellar protein FlaJ
MKMRKIKILGIIVAVVTMLIDLIFLRNEQIFYFILGIAAIIGVSPFVVTILLKSEKEKEKEEMFLEFSRNLVESVKSGNPIGKSILNVKEKDYGSLTPHIKKLANQISLGIPIKNSLETFARDIGSKVISRAITLISEAEQAGGEIETILDSVAKSVSQTEKLKKERKSAIYTLVVQGYIIFFIFIVIMLVMEFKIIPMTAGLGFEEEGVTDIGGLGLGLAFGKVSIEELTRPFLYLLLVQGVFAGLTIGKLSEGNIKAGIKHSFILVVLAWLISTGTKVFLT